MENLDVKIIGNGSNYFISFGDLAVTISRDDISGYYQDALAYNDNSDSNKAKREEALQFIIMQYEAKLDTLETIKRKYSETL